MEILFLGTSSGWPLPRLGCNCELCKSNDPKDIRLRPSILVNNSVIIDAPPDIYHQLTKFNVDTKKITTVILTHAHDDHIMGLFDLSHIYNGTGKITLISTEGVLAHTKHRMGISMLGFNIMKAKPFEKINLDKQTDLWLIPVNHTVEAYAIKMKAPKPFVYAPEFRRIRSSSKKELGNVDLAIIDGSSKTHRGQAKGHETIEEGLRLGKEIRARKILFTNIGHKTDTHQNLNEFVKTQGSDKFSIAFDGMRLKL